MKKGIGLLLLTSALCLNLGPFSAAGRSVSRFETAEEGFNAFVLQAMDRTGVPGLSLTILDRGRIESARTFGVKNRTTKDPVSGGTVFEACSLSKPVLAYAALTLVAEGRLDLDKPLLAQASEEILAREFFGQKIEDDRIRNITPRMVLSHRSGFPNWRGAEMRLRLIANPGTQFGYSGEGFVFLQKAMEQIVGRPFNEFVTERVFVPLGMTSSSYVWIPDYDARAAAPHSLLGATGRKGKPSRANGAATLHTTSRDYALFLAALLKGPGLRDDLRREMLTEQTPVAAGVGWGLGVGLEKAEGREYVWHWGDNGDFKCFFLVDRESLSGFVYFTNGFSGLSLAPEFARRILGGAHPAFSTRLMDEYDPLDSPVFDVIEAASAGHIEDGLNVVRKAAAEDAGKVREAGLNGLGYALMAQGGVDDAIKVFELNVELFPRSWNVYDSLGEAWDKKGNTEAAIRNYELSLKLNPANTQAAKRLQALRNRK